MMFVLCSKIEMTLSFEGDSQLDGSLEGFPQGPKRGWLEVSLTWTCPGLYATLYATQVSVGSVCVGKGPL